MQHEDPVMQEPWDDTATGAQPALWRAQQLLGIDAVRV